MSSRLILEDGQPLWYTGAAHPGSLVLYQPLLVFFGIAGVVQAWAARHPQYSNMRWLSLWAFFALAVAMLYPARQVADLAWALIPLWALTAMEIDWNLSSAWLRANTPIALGQAALIFLLLVFAWFAMAGLSNFTGDMQQMGLRSAILFDYWGDCHGCGDFRAGSSWLELAHGPPGFGLRADVELRVIHAIGHVGKRAFTLRGKPGLVVLRFDDHSSRFVLENAD